MSSFTPDGPAPPLLPPKPSSQDASRMGTPLGPSSLGLGLPNRHAGAGAGVGTGAAGYSHPSEQSMAGGPSTAGAAGMASAAGSSGTRDTTTRDEPPPPPPPTDPGEHWLPQVLQDKSTHDLLEILASPALLDAITHSPTTAHPSLSSSHSALHAALAENLSLAQSLADAESHLAALRSATQARLLSTHALERQWRNKQSDMDHALARFAPQGLYQLLARGVAEQALVCQAMEDSFLEARGPQAHDEDAGGPAGSGAAVGEREAGDWIRRYREAKVLYYLRQERKERWDEGRVGGWR